MSSSTPASDNASVAPSMTSSAEASTSDDACSLEESSSERSFVSISSRRSSACAPRPPLDSLLGLPARLSRALSSTEYAGSPYAFSAFDLPPPGLRVSPMSEPIAFPLLPSQAEELAAIASICPHGRGLETVVDTNVRDCVQIEPARIAFENPKWSRELDDLFYEVCYNLGVPREAVNYELYKLLLYKEGGYFDMHVDSEKTQGMFATCTVQLRSHFKGGNLVFRHDDREEVLCAGSDDGTNQFQCFYTAFYADVQHVIRPIEEGYRLTLVYNMLWIGNCTPPSANPEHLVDVKSALQEHADMSPDGDWYLSFMLEHEYTSSSISSYGTDALKGVDHRRVGSLSVAAQSLGIGELDFVLCKLGQVHGVRADELLLPPQTMYIDETRLNLLEAYWGSGEEFPGDLQWVDWTFASFSKKVKERGPRPTGNEVHNIETTYHAMAVMVWASDRRIEALSRGRWYEVDSFLWDGGPVELSATRADRMLGCIRRGYVPREDWNRTKDVLMFCLERGLHEQASKTLVFAATLGRGEGIDGILFEYVSKYGWDVIGDAVGRYLCYFDEPKRKHKVEPLWILFQLLPWMPIGTAGTALSTIMKVVEHHYRDRPRMCRRFGNCGLKRWDLEKFWVTLMSVVAGLEQKCNDLNIEGRAGVSSVATHIVSVLGGMNEKEITPVYEVLLRSTVENASKHLDEFLAISKMRLLTLRRRRFESDAKYIMQNETVGRYGEGYSHFYDDDEDDKFRDKGYSEDHEYRTRKNREYDWSVFLSLCKTVACRKDLPLSTAKVLGDLLEELALLSEKDIEALLIVVSGLQCDSEEEEFFTMLEKKAREAQAKIYERQPDTSEEVDEGSSGQS